MTRPRGRPRKVEASATNCSQCGGEIADTEAQKCARCGMDGLGNCCIGEADHTCEASDDVEELEFGEDRELDPGSEEDEG